MMGPHGKKLGASASAGLSQRSSGSGANRRPARAEVRIATDVGADTRSYVFGVLWLTAALFAAWAIVATASAFAAPAVTVTEFSLTPSTTTAGASPDATVSSNYSYSNPTEDLKTAIVNFPPGLLGNPEALPKCSEAELQAAACPPETQVGTSVFSAFWVGVGPLPPAPGMVYNAELLGGEAGRLGIITPTPFGALISEIPFTVRTATDYGLTGVLDDVPRTLGPLNIQTVGLSFTLNGATNGFTRNPTSCAVATSTGQAIGYDDPTVIDGPPSSFTPTGCDSLLFAQSFAPDIAISMGDRGTTARNGNPPLRIAIGQSAGEPDMSGNTITLPEELNVHTAAFAPLCNDVQAASHSCPAASQVGGATATSPFLAEPLSGPVYMADQPGRSLPGLLVDLQGRVPIRIDVTTEIVNNTQIKSTVAGLPQLPIGSFNLGLYGGPKSLFVNRSNLCFESGSTSKIKSIQSAVTASGYNGSGVSTQAGVDVRGCQPGVSARLTRAQSANPRLRVTVDRYPTGEKINRLKIRLPKSMRLVPKKIKGASGRTAARIKKSSFRIRGLRTLEVRNLPDGSVRKVTVVLSKGAVRINRGLRKAVRSGRKRRVRVRVVAFPATGKFLVSRTIVPATR